MPDNKKATPSHSYEWYAKIINTRANAGYKYFSRPSISECNGFPFCYFCYFCTFSIRRHDPEHYAQNKDVDCILGEAPKTLASPN